MSKSVPKYVGKCTETCRKVYRNMSESVPKHVGKCTETCRKVYRSMSESVPKHAGMCAETCRKVPNISKSVPKHAGKSTETCRKVYRNISASVLKHVRNGTETCWRYVFVQYLCIISTVHLVCAVQLSTLMYVQILLKQSTASSVKHRHNYICRTHTPSYCPCPPASCLLHTKPESARNLEYSFPLQFNALYFTEESRSANFQISGRPRTTMELFSESPDEYVGRISQSV